MNPHFKGPHLVPAPAGSGRLSIPSSHLPRPFCLQGHSLPEQAPGRPHEAPGRLSERGEFRPCSTGGGGLHGRNCCGSLAGRRGCWGSGCRRPSLWGKGYTGILPFPPGVERAGLPVPETEAVAHLPSSTLLPEVRRTGLEACSQTWRFMVLTALPYLVCIIHPCPGCGSRRGWNQEDATYSSACLSLVTLSSHKGITLTCTRGLVPAAEKKVAYKCRETRREGRGLGLSLPASDY